MVKPVASPEDDPTGRALADALPAIRRITRDGWAMVAGVAAVTAFVALFVVPTITPEVEWRIYVAIAGALAAFAILRSVQTSHEKTIMPIVAAAFGLTHVKGDQNYLKAMPPVFIPQGNVGKVDDTIVGQVAGRTFRFAEVRTATGGKNSRTLFRGIVMDVPCRAGLPDFILVAEKQTQGLFWGKGNVPVDGLIRTHQARSRAGDTYGVWSRSHAPKDIAGLQAFVDRMLAAGDKVGGTATLYSMVCTGSRHFVALSHARDLFTIGGLFATQAVVMADIRRAAEQVAYPVNLVSEILLAEDALLSPPVTA